MPDRARAPLFGDLVRVMGVDGRAVRRRVVGVIDVEAGELRAVEDGQPSSPARIVASVAASRQVKVQGLGWCPVHDDAAGPYVRAAEASPHAHPLFPRS